MDYIIFNVDFNLNNKFYTFFNKYGKKPYLEEGKLYIPVEMVNDKYLNYFNIKPKEKEEDPKKNEQIQKEKEQQENYDKENILFSKLSKREPTGLINIGGICYLNAVLQCFFYCKPLTNYFLNLENDIIKKLGPISKGYYDFIQGLCSNNIYAATNFKKAMIDFDDTFIGTEGKDSKDVAILLLSEIQEELKEKNILYQGQNLKQEKIEIECKNKTIINDIFSFFIKYEQKCTNNCPKYKKKYFNVETDNIMIFELEKIYKEINKKNGSKKYEISLEECLDHYNKWVEKAECPYCNKFELKIRKTICSLPKIFIFVLSRGYNVQFDCKIIFEKELDMQKYYKPLEEKENITNNTKYNLIGATFSYDWTKGMKHTGHTVAFCKTYKEINNISQYYIFNDKYQKKAKIDDINNKIPYLLFYEKEL